MNVLIVDDEPLIHISIEKNIHEISKDITVTHAFSGNEMLTLLPKSEYFLVLVDIKMPGISGLEAIKEARNISPFSTYYIMTGFDEFEYAKQAIHLKVEDYLMKPLDLATIRDAIDHASQNHFTLIDHKKECFRLWLEGTLNHRDCSSKEFNGAFCSAILITVDQAQQETETIVNLLEEYNSNLVSVSVEDKIYVLIFSDKFEYINDCIKKIRENKITKEITIFSSSITQDPKELSENVHLLTPYSSLRVILGTGRFYYLKPLTELNNQFLNFCDTCTRLQEAYSSGKYDNFVNLQSLIVQQFRSFNLPDNYCSSLFDYLSLVYNAHYHTSDDKITLLDTALSDISHTLLKSAAAHSKAEEIVKYIQGHFRENISLAELSNRFSLSPGYISNLLKDSVGIKYNDYITSLRLGRARALLISTNFSIKVITEDCGYYSQSHFTKIFMEHEGCTPLEYREKHLNMK